MTYLEQVKETIKERVQGKIEAAHDSFGHHYRLPSGKIVDSVTTKLAVFGDKQHLIKWAVKMGFEWMEKDNRFQKLCPENRADYLKGAVQAHEDNRDFAGDIGHQGHAVIENYVNEWIKSGAAPADIRSFISEGTNYRVYAVARSAEAAFLKYNVIPVASELLVGSEKYNAAGTLDLLVMNENNQLELWDFKSSNSVKDDYAIQVSAYKKFFEDMTLLSIKKCRILHLSKDSDKYGCYDIPKTGPAFVVFKNISKAYDWSKNGLPKLVNDKIIIKL